MAKLFFTLTLSDQTKFSTYPINLAVLVFMVVLFVVALVSFLVGTTRFVISPPQNPVQLPVNSIFQIMLPTSHLDDIVGYLHVPSANLSELIL